MIPKSKILDENPGRTELHTPANRVWSETLQATDDNPPSATDSNQIMNSSREGPSTPGLTPPPASQSSGGAGSSGFGGFIVGAINSAIALVRNPVNYITSNKDTPATVNGIMLNYVAVLAAIPFFATLIGDLWYYS